jgi:hypothetical protein
MPNNLDINTLEAWLWDAACKIRGAIDVPLIAIFYLIISP